MKVKNLPKIIGDLSWQELRDLLIEELYNCKTENQLSKIISNLLASVGTLEEIKKTRKIFGIRQLTKEEENLLK